jgi:hypothetical protein
MNRTAKVLGIVLVLVLLSGGFYLAYQSGFDNGALSAAAAGDNGTPVIVDRDWGRGGFGFFPFGILFPLLLLFLIFGAFRSRFGGPRWGYGPGWGPGASWGPSSEEHMKERLDEWHKKAHDQA